MDDQGPPHNHVEVFTTMNFDVKLTRVIDNILVPSTIKFSADFEPHEDMTENDIDITFAKIRYWLDNIVSRCLVFSHDNDHALAMFINENGHPRTGNVVMLTPDEPDDQHLAALFQAKLTALSDGNVEFGPMEVKSDNIMGLTFTFVGDPDLILPTMEQWVGPRSYFDRPWWNRNDGSTLDAIPADDADLDVKPGWAFTFEFLDRPKHAPAPKDEKTVVVRPQFRPTIIDGGKDED